MEKKFIEYDLPIAKISKEAAHEKNVHIGLPPQFHVWWARRPLSSSRVTSFAALIDDPGKEKNEERKEIIKLIKDLSSWKIAKNENSHIIDKARNLILKKYNKKPPKVLDPYAGGGTIPLESVRIGMEAYASDYNPVAVFIEKATIEWPNKFDISIKLPEDINSLKNNSIEKSIWSNKENVNLLEFLVERWAKKIIKSAKDELGKFYPEDNSKKLVGRNKINCKEGWIPVSYIWARTVPCQNPNCGLEIPLIRQYWLARKKNKQIAYRPIIDKINDTIDFEILEGDNLKNAIKKGFDPSEGTVSRANVTCPSCNQVIESKKLRSISKQSNMQERLISIVFHHPDQCGKRYRIANAGDLKTFSNAKKELQKKIKNYNNPEEIIPNEDIPLMSGTFNVPLYGLDKWEKLFNSRQLLSLTTLMENIWESYDKIYNEVKLIKQKNTDINFDNDSLTKSVLGYLSLLLTREIDFSSSLCVWDSSAEISKHTFGRQALPMTWDYSEVNPFSGSTGSLRAQLRYLLKSLRNFFTNNDIKPSVQQFSATGIPYDDKTFDAIFTDPPYYNSVPYADLSDFFYVWLKRTLNKFFPQLFATPLTPKTEEAVEMSGWDSKRYSHKDDTFFEKQLGKSFQEMYRVLKSGGISIIVYAHKTTEGWETMLNALINAGFIVTASWPIHTEMKSRLRAKASAALASSIYMVCRKSERKSLGFWKDLKPKIKTKVEKKLKQFWNEGIVGGDLFISAIGPGMEVFSKYKEVEKYSGKQVTTNELLTYIRSITTDFVVNRLLKDASPSQIDKESQFYLAYRWTYLDNKVEYDAARKIASGMGVDIEELDNKYNFIKKTRKYVRVFGPNKRTDNGNIKDIEVECMVDAMHKCLLLWEKGRKKEINRILAETGYGNQGSFWQFCQAVAESLIQGNDEKKLLEGFLIGRDKYIKSSSEIKDTEKQRELFKED